jgi:hypothetical protein
LTYLPGPSAENQLTPYQPSSKLASLNAHNNKPESNDNASFEFLKLDTRERIVHSRWTRFPATESVIKSMNMMAANERRLRTVRPGSLATTTTTTSIIDEAPAEEARPHSGSTVSQASGVDDDSDDNNDDDNHDGIDADISDHDSIRKVDNQPGAPADTSNILTCRAHQLQTDSLSTSPPARWSALTPTTINAPDRKNIGTKLN